MSTCAASSRSTKRYFRWAILRMPRGEVNDANPRQHETLSRCQGAPESTPVRAAKGASPAPGLIGGLDTDAGQFPHSTPCFLVATVHGPDLSSRPQAHL